MWLTHFIDISTWEMRDMGEIIDIIKVVFLLCSYESICFDILLYKLCACGVQYEMFNCG